MGEDADLGAGPEKGFEIRLGRQLEIRGILGQPQRLLALQAFEDQRLAETGVGHSSLPKADF
ncbi:hypothetical protein [Syntrophotalea acetylenivorans]|uniref:hypothetical protein n=1 Tax=Syntrophotalea acetylenivorans TaxID=1842532 RepID=UPI001F28924B|nr:hypothetical protein [Syntrophotalea acetylenivorans]